jgi:hypothetical protein
VDLHIGAHYMNVWSEIASGILYPLPNCWIASQLSHSPGPESGAQGQGIRTAYGLIPNYLEGEGTESKDSTSAKEKESADKVKKETQVKLEAEEEVSCFDAVLL